jgi:hypothetical protein
MLIDINVDRQHRHALYGQSTVGGHPPADLGA